MGFNLFAALALMCFPYEGNRFMSNRVAQQLSQATFDIENALKSLSLLMAGIRSAPALCTPHDREQSEGAMRHIGGAIEAALAANAHLAATRKALAIEGLPRAQRRPRATGSAAKGKLAPSQNAANTKPAIPLGPEKTPTTQAAQ